MTNELDPALMALLVSTFKGELDELSQEMTQALLALENNAPDFDRTRCLDALFRNAHNIKGAARGVNANVITEIAHHLETLFSRLKQRKLEPTSQVIGLCLECLDRMQDGMTSFSSGRALPFDLAALIARLVAIDPVSVAPPAAADLDDSNAEHFAEHNAPAKIGAESSEASVKPSLDGPELTRVALSRLDRVSALAEELMASRIEMDDHLDVVLRIGHDIELQARRASDRRNGVIARKNAEDALSKDRLTQMLEEIKKLKHDVQRLYKDMRGTGTRLGILAEGLQDEVRAMRLVPASSLLRPLSRTVRDIAQQLGKKIEYVVTGDDIQLDRPILEGIKAPLTHLVRNAIDHGIESPEDRSAAGKVATGKISIAVQGIGNRVVITVRDDGAGIDVAQIAHAAVRKKLISAAEAGQLSAEETLDLIFLPGFSSKEMITDISGRGVGLDVVLSNLRSLNGSVTVDSVLGQGTCFTLSLPLTMSTDRGLMVRSGANTFAIPSASVERVLEVKSSQVLDVEASQVILLDGKPVPARDLGQILELPYEETLAHDRLPVVVIAKGWQRVALLVDEIIGEREIVIKRLRPPLVSIRNVIGGTLTGSGKVIMVLNPSDIVTSAMQQGNLRRIVAKQDREVVPFHILVVDDSITTRTLEKNALENHGYRVTVAVDGKLGWEAIQAERFDLVLTDVEMPNMNGFELTEQIKQSEKYRELPVVLVTSLASEADRRRGVEVGADAYIVKGQFETRKLLDIIKQLL